MSPEENVQIMRRWFQEVWNEGRMQTIHELFSPEGVARGQESPEGELHGPKEFEGFVRKIRGAFPDMKLEVEDVFATGDKGVLRWSGVMKHTGDAMGMPASGRTVRLRGITLVRFAGGKVVESWDNWDQLGMLQQIGALDPAVAA
jgi:steroid delta-isomerase-like uncharacterized protein